MTTAAAECLGFEPNALRRDRISSPAQRLAAGTLHSIGGRPRSRTLIPCGSHGFQDRCQTIPAGPSDLTLVSGEGFEPITVLILNQVPPTVGLTGQTGAGGRTRTGTVHALRVPTPAVGLRPQLVAPRSVDLRSPA